MKLTPFIFSCCFLTILIWPSKAKRKKELECGIDPFEWEPPQEPARRPEIIEGVRVNRTVPWLVKIVATIKYKNGLYDNQECVGVIIDQWHVVTAAHCLVRKHKETKSKATIEMVTVILDRDKIMDKTTEHEENTKEMLLKPGNVVFDDRFKDDTDLRYDFALLRLNWPITFGVSDYNRVNRICVPGYNWPKEQVANQKDAICTVTGWGSYLPETGFTKFPKLFKTNNVTLIQDEDEIKTSKADFEKSEGVKIDTKQHIIGRRLADFERKECGVHEDKNTGAPLACLSTKDQRRWLLVGIDSFGECDNESLSVFTKVSLYTDWIKDKIKKLKKTATSKDKPDKRPEHEKKLVGIECGVDPLQSSSKAGSENLAPEGEVKNGVEKMNSTIPWLVRLFVQIKGKTMKRLHHFCAGVLIDEWHVMTAAHCVAWAPGKDKDKEEEKWTTELVTVYFDTLKFNTWEFEENPKAMILKPNNIVFDHEFQKNKNKKFDLAMLRLKWPITFGVGDYKRVNKICLPGFNDDDFDDENTDICTVSGWQSTLSSAVSKWIWPQHLLRANVTISGRDTKNLIQIVEKTVGLKLSDLMQTVAKGKLLNTFFSEKQRNKKKNDHECEVDTGGPLVCLADNGKSILVGINSLTGCGDQKLPSVYTNVDNYRAWIKNKIEELEKTSTSMDKPDKRTPDEDEEQKKGKKNN